MENERAFAKGWLIAQPFFLAFAVLYAWAYRACTCAGLSFFRCVISSTLGFYCPGCGGSRAVVALLCGRVIRAFLLYPPVVIAVACLAVADAKMVLCLMRRGHAPSRRFGLVVLFLCVGSVILQCAIKNVLLLCGVDILGDIL